MAKRKAPADLETLPNEALTQEEGGGLQRTSMQLTSEMVSILDAMLPGKSRSEALRLVLDRYFFLLTYHQIEMQLLVNSYYDALDFALRDYDEWDFRTIAKVLPSLLAAAKDENVQAPDADFDGAIRATTPLNYAERIQVLDEYLKELRSRERQRR